MHDDSERITSLIVKDLKGGSKVTIGRGKVGTTPWQVIILAALRLNLKRNFYALTTLRAYIAFAIHDFYQQPL